MKVGAVSIRMKTKLLLLIWLTVMAIGCTQTPMIESKNVGSPVGTKNGDLPPKKHEKNKPLVQQKLASVLYRLTMAPEPEPFAKQHGLFFLNDKIKVYVYFTPDVPSSEIQRVVDAHHIQLEKRANDLVSAWVPVDRLVPLSKEAVVRIISPPKTLKKTDGKMDD